MKISRNWLQTFFSGRLPPASSLAEALTFHAFEIESIEKLGHPMSNNQTDYILNVKITPNRGHDCLSHRSIAKELSAILKVPMTRDPLRETIVLGPKTEAFKVTVENPKLCPRFTAAYIKDLRIGPSPEWLRTALESVGQKSINNVVDATNYVMFDMGQPLHAFDAAKLREKKGMRALTVRLARKGEKMLGLDDKEYALATSMLTIADGNTGEPVSIAGIKGGKPTSIDEATTDIILEAANWDGATIRKTSQALKLRTDASERFQQVISPELTAHGLKAAADLIVKLAGGEVVGFVDEYPHPQEKGEVSVSLQQVNETLGTGFGAADVADVFKRLDLPCTKKGDEFTVSIPFERLDLTIPEDLIEEVGRIIGYDKIPATPLPPFPRKPEINAQFYAAEHVREDLAAEGYSEVFTSVFADEGERAVANKVDSVHPYLRSTLLDGLAAALEKNVRNKDLLGLKEVKLFEIGTTWQGKRERTMVGTVGEKEKPKEIPLPDTSSTNALTVYENFSLSSAERFAPFSRYPFIVRDIALWTDAGAQADDVLNVIRAQAGELLMRSELFDRFEKGGKTSLAFRLVFQSFEKTLTDAEVNAVMEKVNAGVKEKGWEVR